MLGAKVQGGPLPLGKKEILALGSYVTGAGAHAWCFVQEGPEFEVNAIGLASWRHGRLEPLYPPLM